MKPTVGRIVHYTNLGDKDEKYPADGKCPTEQLAAIITGVKQDNPGPSVVDENQYAVDLHIFYRTGEFWMLDVPFSADYERGHWSWPPKV